MEVKDEYAEEHCRRIFRDCMELHSEDAMSMVLENCRLVTYEKGEILFHAGEIMSDCVFIVSGSFYDYARFDDGRDIVTCICGDYGDPAVPFSALDDFLKPLGVTIEALEPMKALLVPTEVMIQLITGFPEAAASMARIVSKWNVIHSKMAMYNVLPIAKRYEAFKELYPGLFGRLPQNSIAKMLNTTPSALSRALYG